MSDIPQPILDDQPEWLALYDAAWKIAVGKIKHGTRKNRFAKRFMGEAFSNHLFQWDTCLMSMFARYAPDTLPALAALDNFYGTQHADGFICRELVEADGSDYFDKESDQSINPPLFAFAELNYARVTGDLSHATRALPVLVKYYDWIRINREAGRGAKRMLWTGNLGSGMDNSPREARGWVCITAQQALAAECIAEIAARAGNHAIARRMRQEHRTLVSTLNTRSWSAEHGYYWDVYPSGRHSHRKTIATFWPMMAGVPDATQAVKLVKHLKNPREFFRPHLFPSLAADEQAYEHKGLYWLGGVWAPTNYAVIKGLERYGFDDFARTAAENHIGMMHAVCQNTGTIWETYAPELVEQGSIARRDFVGWSGLGPIAMLIEHVIGLRVDALNRRIHWVTRAGDAAHGIKHLRFGDGRVDLIRRNGHMEITTSQPFDLELTTGRRKRTIRVERGTHTFTV
jgi:glycogen debranching enzyme